MNWNRTTLLRLAAAISLFLCPAIIAAQDGEQAERTPQNYAPKAGEPHVDFTLPRIDNGEAVSLSDYRGKRVILIQFASW